MYRNITATDGYRAILNKVNKEILTAHLKNCVSHAESQAEKEEKIDELVDMLGRILK